MHLDLNLLTALDALLEEGSVTGAANRLHLTPPATSRALSRIRRATGDEILVRSGRTMVATPYALSVREQVHGLLSQAHAVLAPARTLDLATLDRVFTLRCHDAVTLLLGPPLLAEIAEHAPGVRLRLLAEASTDTDELRHGRVDLEVGAAVPDPPEIRSVTVGRDRLVVAVRPGHPLAAGALTPERYAAARHVTTSRRGRLADPVDDALGRLGLRREVVCSAPTSTAALHIAASSDLVVTGPERMCRPSTDSLGLVTVQLPVGLDLPAVPLVCSWHQRYDGDPAHTWLREQVTVVLERALRDTA